MTNHPNRSRKHRVVTLKIVEGGYVVRVDDATTSDLAIRVTGVPADVRDSAVATKVNKVVLLPMGGPWVVAWERLADAVQGAILRDCKGHHERPAMTPADLRDRAKQVRSEQTDDGATADMLQAAADEIDRLRAELGDYREMVAEWRDLTRRLDVALNGDGAAKQASLCDLVAQFEKH